MIDLDEVGGIAFKVLFLCFRLPALTFVLSHCGKKSRGVSALQSQPYLLGTDHDVMCRYTP